MPAPYKAVPHPLSGDKYQKSGVDGWRELPHCTNTVINFVSSRSPGSDFIVFGFGLSAPDPNLLRSPAPSSQFFILLLRCLMIRTVAQLNDSKRAATFQTALGALSGLPSCATGAGHVFEHLDSPHSRQDGHFPHSFPFPLQLPFLFVPPNAAICRPLGLLRPAAAGKEWATLWPPGVLAAGRSYGRPD